MSEITMRQAITEYLDHLQAQGKQARTLYTYGKDCEQILAFFGAERPLASITPALVGRFLNSEELNLLPKGTPRSQRTVDKTIRVFRMLLVWAQGQGYLAEAPLPKRIPMGHSLQDLSKNAI
jgi:site-specific recombinase XerD